MSAGKVRIARRGFLVLSAGAALAGCGFQPVYMPTASGQAGPAQRELAAIDVALIPDRPGMLLAQELELSSANIVVGEGIDSLFGYTVRLFTEPGDAVVSSLGAYPTFNFHVA